VYLVKIANGTEHWVVGFVPRAFLKHESVINSNNKVVQVLEIYKLSTNTHKQYLLKCNKEMATAIVVYNVPHNA
jgi:hypothetical protein